MRKGSLPRSIVVPSGLVGRNYSPDGLTEADIDALIAEVSSEVRPIKRRPSWVSADQVETRRTRHRDRQAVRALSAALSEVAWSWPDQDEVA